MPAFRSPLAGAPSAPAPWASTPPAYAPPADAPPAYAPPVVGPLVARDGRSVTVVHLTGELAPYARTGGLGEAVASLAAHQAAAGIPTAIVMPLYRQATDRAGPLVPVGEAFDVTIAGRREPARLYVRADDTGAPRLRPRHYFVANAFYFDRAGIYGASGGDYGDNARRYAFFCAAALQALSRIAEGPIVVHAHDWHAALAPVYLRTWWRDDPAYGAVRAVLSVHNAGFQGHFPAETVPDLGLPWEAYDYRRLEWYGRLNLLKGGLAFADAATTVSPTHATELRTADGGFGLDGAFRALGDRFSGILNGIDQTVWDPARDPHLAASFTRDALAGKRACRAALQRAYGLPVRPDVPILAMTARLVWQKGLDLVLAETGAFDLDAQWIFLGAGEPRYEDALRARQLRHPGRVRVDTRFEDVKEHRLIAGADVLLMPCQYEPCGLTQMRAQRYGTLPLVRAVGGLADTVENGRTGFVFRDYDARAYLAAVVRAVRTYRDRLAWERMMREAMGRDFGWARSAERYLDVYRRVVVEAATV